MIIGGGHSYLKQGFQGLGVHVEDLVFLMGNNPMCWVECLNYFDRYLGGFRFLAVTNNAVMDDHVQVFVILHVSLLGMYTGAELLSMDEIGGKISRGFRPWALVLPHSH